MEPITLGFLLAAAVSGVVGNKADKAIDLAVGKSLQAFTNPRQHGDELSAIAGQGVAFGQVNLS